MFDEVEKRWHHLDSLGAAVLYVVAVIAVATVAFAAYALGDRHDLAWAFTTSGVLLLGAVGAFVKTHRDWRARRTWAI